MSIPFRPEREKDVTTWPFAGHRQRFTAALPPFAAPDLLFFELPVAAVFLLVDVSPADFFEDLDAALEETPGARVLLLWPPDERFAVCVEAVLGGCVKRSF